MILHLLNDPKFANTAYDFFEKYYPGQNHFFMQVSRHEKKTKINQQQKRFFKTSFTKKTDINHLIKYALDQKVQSILVHNLSPTKAAIANIIKNKSGAETYWIFYGADLYSYLNSIGKYTLLDSDHSLSKKKYKKEDLKLYLAFWYLFLDYPNHAYIKFIKRLNYFCFWNNYDFFLLKKHFVTKASFKPFLYYPIINRNNPDIDYRKTFRRVLINHSASPNGNHETILKKLESLPGNEKITEIVIPLSYGSDSIKTEIGKYAYEIFGERAILIKDFMPVEEYYLLLKSISVAIFGNRRQEAGANVFYLLGKGAKIFLRNDNNMIHWLRERGFTIYSFEDDLNSSEDLNPLSSEEIKKNIRIYDKLFSEENEIISMESLINNSGT